MARLQYEAANSLFDNVPALLLLTGVGAAYTKQPTEQFWISIVPVALTGLLPLLLLVSRAFVRIQISAQIACLLLSVYDLYYHTLRDGSASYDAMIMLMNLLVLVVGTSNLNQYRNLERDLKMAPFVGVDRLLQVLKKNPSRAYKVDAIRMTRSLLIPAVAVLVLMRLSPYSEDWFVILWAPLVAAVLVFCFITDILERKWFLIIPTFALFGLYVLLTVVFTSQWVQCLQSKLNVHHCLVPLFSPYLYSIGVVCVWLNALFLFMILRCFVKYGKDESVQSQLTELRAVRKELYEQTVMRRQQ